MIANTTIYGKLKILNFLKRQFNYLSLGEIVSQDFLNGKKTDLSVEIHIVKNPGDFLKGKTNDFSEFYKISETSIYYKRKYGGITLQLLVEDIHTNNIKVYFNKIYYNLIRFKVDNLYPIGLHLTDILLPKLIKGGNLVVHGASIYNENSNSGFSLVAPPDTGKTYTTFKFLETDGFKFLGEDLSLWDSKKNTINCMPYTSTWEHRFNLSKLNIGKIPFIGLFIDRKKHSVYDIFGEEKVQNIAPSKHIYLLEKSSNENSIKEISPNKIKETIRKVKVIQRNEFSYYKNPLMLALDYNNNIDLPGVIEAEDKLIEKYFNDNRVFIAKGTDYKNYYQLIKEHQGTL